MTVPHRQWLEERLRQLGLSRTDLAKRVGVSKRQVERWFSGKGAHRTTQYDIALALNLQPQQIYALFAANSNQVRTMSVQGEQDTDGEYRPVSDHAFYDYYASRIAGARNDVWVTSDGFNMSSKVSRRYAGIMEPGFRSALSNGALVHRYQIVETMHINWIDELIRIKSDYPRLFRLFINREAEETRSVCSIDANLDQCVAETFEGTSGGFCQGTVAASYSFRLHDRTKARQNQDIVESAIDASGAEELSMDGLQELRKELFQSRVERLKRWYEDNDDDEYVSLADSGVFDEVVVSYFVRQAVKKKL